jgi:hypothetical protein
MRSDRNPEAETHTVQDVETADLVGVVPAGESDCENHSQLNNDREVLSLITIPLASIRGFA